MLGYLIFDSNNSFYYFNPIDCHNFGKCKELSKRHELTNNNATTFAIEDGDLVNNRICFYTRVWYDNDSTNLGKYCKMLTIKRKFMYLIDNDMLIQDYQFIEGKTITDYLNSTNNKL